MHHKLNANHPVYVEMNRYLRANSSASIYLEYKMDAVSGEERPFQNVFAMNGLLLKRTIYVNIKYLLNNYVYKGSAVGKASFSV